MSHVTAIVLGALILDLAQAGLTASYAWSKGHPAFAVFIATAFLGFPLPVLLIALAPDRIGVQS